jgi:hypothetical protein
VKNNARREKCDSLSEDDPAIAALEQVDISEEVILLDVRNEYETKIGSFQIRDEVGNVISAATDPRTRQVRALDLLLLEKVTSNIICICCFMCYENSFQTLQNLLMRMLVITWARRFLCTALVTKCLLSVF